MGISELAWLITLGACMREPVSQQNGCTVEQTLWLPLQFGTHYRIVRQDRDTDVRTEIAKVGCCALPRNPCMQVYCPVALLQGDVDCKGYLLSWCIQSRDHSQIAFSQDLFLTFTVKGDLPCACCAPWCTQEDPLQHKVTTHAAKVTGHALQRLLVSERQHASWPGA